MKRDSQRDRVRRHLLEHGSITRDYAVYTMRPGINRLSERIRELQAEGMAVSEGQHVPGTSDTLYTLAGGPKPKLVSMRTPEGFAVRVSEKRIEEAKARGLVLLDE